MPWRPEKNYQNSVTIYKYPCLKEISLKGAKFGNIENIQIVS